MKEPGLGKAWRIAIGLLELGQCPILERPATKRHTQHKPIIEEPLHDTTTSATDDVKVVMDEIKKKLVTWGQFEKVLRDSKLRHGEAA